MKQPMTLQEMLEKRTVSKLMRQTFSATVCPPVQIPEGMTELELAKTEELGKVVNKETDESIVRTYRALSATLLPGIFIDFGAKDGKVLKNAMKHFKQHPTGQNLGVFKDHNKSVDAWLGRVLNSYWDEGNASYPAGVNSVLEFDRAAIGKTIERGLVTGGLNSVSVTIDFEWTPSHPDMDNWEFFTKLGEEIDGETVRIVATKVHGIYEISLVWEGADPFAKEVLAASALSSGVQGTNVKEALTAKDGNRETEANSALEAKEDQMNEILQSFCSKLGLTYEQEPENEALQNDLLAKLDAINESVNQLSAESKAKEDRVAALQAELDAAKKIVDATMSQTLEKLAINAKLTMGSEEAAAPVLKLAAKSNLEDLSALADEYEKRAEQLHPLRCQDCGCTKVSRQTSAYTKPNVGVASSVDGITGITERDIHQLEEIHLMKR